MMGNRPKNPANARNKNVLVVGGSGSGKTRFWLKPNLLQCHSSYVVTDPKGDIVIDCGQALLKNGYSIRIFNTINFRKSMHYNPFAYIHSEKDILKLTTTLIANTKGDGKAGDEFWTKAETLLYCALIGYIHYEAPLEEQNFATLIEFLNAMEVREDMDSRIFLGGSEPTTLKELNQALGKETIDLYNTSDTRGNSPSYGTNYQKVGHDMPYLLVKSSAALNLT